MIKGLNKRSKGRSFVGSNIEMIKMIYKSLDCTKTLVSACQAGRIEIAKSIMASEMFSVEELNDAFLAAVSYGHLEIGKYMLNEYEINCDLALAFKQNCQHNNLEVCLWIFHDIQFYRISEELLIEMFNYTCSNKGDKFEMAMWLFSIIGESINFNKKNAILFRNACSNNNPRIAKWIWDVMEVDECAGKGEAFRNACINDNYEIMKWLYAKNEKVVNFVTPNDIAKINNKETIIWIFNCMQKIGTSMNYDAIFKIMCCNDKLEMAQWLTQIPELNINTTKFYTIINDHCIKRGRPGVIDWIDQYNGFIPIN